HQRLVGGGGVVAGRGVARDGRVVVVALGDGLLEDGGVRGHATQAVLLDQPLEGAVVDPGAADLVEVDRLPVALQLLEWVHGSPPSAGTHAPDDTARSRRPGARGSRCPEPALGALDAGGVELVAA